MLVTVLKHSLLLCSVYEEKKHYPKYQCKPQYSFYITRDFFPFPSSFAFIEKCVPFSSSYSNGRLSSVWLLQTEHLRHHVVGGGMEQDPPGGQSYHHVAAHG